MEIEPPPYLPVNHVFVDYENIKSIDLSVVGRKSFMMHLFLGPLNKRLDVGVVEKLLEHSQTVKLVRSPKAGKNALDFVMAYHLGQAVQTDPKAWFHLVSADEGFDALVELLKARNVKVKRHRTWEGLALPKNGEVPEPAAEDGSAARKPSPKGNVVLSAGATKLLENLGKSAKNRPKKRTTLVSHARSSLGKGATNKQGEALVDELLKAGKLEFDEKGGIRYRI